jgi:hypothetical protein
MMEESFSAPTSKLIKSSAGFSVEEVEYRDLLYREGGMSAHVYFEYNAPGASVPYTIWKGRESIREWETPDGPCAMTDADRDRIADNIRRAYASQGYEIQVL